MGFLMRSENELYAWVLCGHIEGFAYRLESLPEERWDWSPNVAAPTARILAVHRS